MFKLHFCLLAELLHVYMVICCVCVSHKRAFSDQMFLDSICVPIHESTWDLCKEKRIENDQMWDCLFCCGAYLIKVSLQKYTISIYFLLWNKTVYLFTNTFYLCFYSVFNCHSLNTCHFNSFRLVCLFSI